MYTGDTPNVVVHTVYLIDKGQEKAFKTTIERKWETRPASKGLVGCRLAWLKEKGPGGETKLSSIVYWKSAADAASPQAEQEARELKKMLKRYVVRQRSNQGKVLWHGQTPLGLKISLNVAPIQLTICPPFWRQISNFFTMRKLSSLENLTMQKLALARQVGAETLSELLNSHVNLGMQVEWAAPKVIVPIDPSRIDRAVAFMDFGQIKVTTTPKIDSDNELNTANLYEHILATLENAHLAFLPSKTALQEQFTRTSLPPRSVAF